jgi:hypothetical protein
MCVYLCVVANLGGKYTDSHIYIPTVFLIFLNFELSELAEPAELAELDEPAELALLWNTSANPKDNRFPVLTVPPEK